MIVVATYLHAVEARRMGLLDHKSKVLPVLRRMYQDGVIYFIVRIGPVGEEAPSDPALDRVYLAALRGDCCEYDDQLVIMARR